MARPLARAAVNRVDLGAAGGQAGVGAAGRGPAVGSSLL